MINLNNFSLKNFVGGTPVDITEKNDSNIEEKIKNIIKLSEIKKLKNNLKPENEDESGTPVDITEKNDNNIEKKIKNIMKLSKIKKLKSENKDELVSTTPKSVTPLPTTPKSVTPVAKSVTPVAKSVTPLPTTPKSVTPVPTTPKSVTPLPTTPKLSPPSPLTITGQLPSPKKSETKKESIDQEEVPLFLQNVITLVKPNMVTNTFDKKTMHKIIDGVSYSSLEEYKKNPIKCFFETCDLTWKMTPWQNR